jgi:hypothetical protein
MEIDGVGLAVTELFGSDWATKEDLLRMKPDRERILEDRDLEGRAGTNWSLL